MSDINEIDRLRARIAELEREREEARLLLRRCVTEGYSRHEINCFLAGVPYRAIGDPPPETCGHDDSSWCDESCDAINAPAAAGRTPPPARYGAVGECAHQFTSAPATAGAPTDMVDDLYELLTIAVEAADKAERMYAYGLCKRRCEIDRLIAARDRFRAASRAWQLSKPADDTGESR